MKSETIWDQLEKETPLAYEAFCSYLALGPGRTLKAAAENLHGDDSTKRSRSFSRWSSQNNWVNRARAWDRAMAREKHQEALKERRRQGRKMADRHANNIQGLMGVLLEPAKILADKLGDKKEQDKLKKLSPKVLVSLAIGTGKVMPGLLKAERLSRGVDDLDGDGLTVEEFALLVEEITAWAMDYVPRNKMRLAKRDFFRILRRYGVRESDAVQ